MIKNIEAANINYAVSYGIKELLRQGVKGTSRNGTVLMHPDPVCTTYHNPKNRVLFSPQRDANPFFHLMEALWMLAGRNDIGWPSYFAANMVNYSDDGATQNGAYGYRWRKHFNIDQLEFVVQELRRSPDSRRAVLAMWDGAHDMPYALEGGKDAPCNTHIYFSLRRGSLDMLVCCRSNDIVWGAYGANVVHMSILHEYMASWLQAPVGDYRQLSYNFHAYTDVYSEEKLESIAAEAPGFDFYAGLDHVKAYPLMTKPVEKWNKELQAFMSNPGEVDGMADSFFLRTAYPMYAAWKQRKKKEGDGMEFIQTMPKDSDWRLACEAWIRRREAKAPAKE